MPLLLETFISWFSYFGKYEVPTENTAPLDDPPTGIQPAVVAPPVSTVAASSEQPTPHLQTQMLTLPNPLPTPGSFTNTHDFVVNNPVMTSSSYTFYSGGGAVMQLLESKTIQGAEHDSSARYPPPKCHPETRQSLRGEIHDWVLDPKRSWRMFYILGTAGVGKSAVAQTVADEVDCLGASCFISRPNGRDNPDGIIPTLSYQLAVKHTRYKQIISEKLGNDPSILRKARRVQFQQLLIQPFRTIMAEDPSAVQNPLLIIIDGLDECKGMETQCEFIELIGDHVRTFPEFPLLWLICSRPESHLKYTLSQADFQVTCRRKEMLVHDNEGRRDVLIFLESEFRSIRQRYPDSLGCDWPPEVQLQRIGEAASGLFAFASTMTRFIADADAGDPSSQLGVCMRIFESSSISDAENPYDTLDKLYTHILTSIPGKILPTTKRILGLSIFYRHEGPSQSARMQANFLRIKRASYDHALKRLHSVLRIDLSSATFESPIEFYHASFGDFLKDPGRSGELCLDGPAIHYDVALTALSWHMDLGLDMQEGDIWTSPSEDTQICLENIKLQSLTVLWKACSHVGGDNAIDLYHKLQKFDFNALGNRIPLEWEFDHFLSWLHLQEHDFSTQKLMNLINIDEECDEVKSTHALVRWNIISRFTSAESEAIHLDLGNGNQCRHVHFCNIDDEAKRDVLRYLENEFGNIRLQYPSSLGSDWPPEFQLQRIARAASGMFLFATTTIRFIDDPHVGDPSSQLGVFMRFLAGSNVPGFKDPLHNLDLLYKHILASVPSEILPTTKRILGLSIFYWYKGPFRSALMQANFLRIQRVSFHHALKWLHSVLHISSSSGTLRSSIRPRHESFGDFLKDAGRSGEFCLDEAAIHYDVALTALSWLMDLGLHTRDGDTWASPSEGAQFRSLAVLWRACSHVERDNAMDFYHKLQSFDFNVLGRHHIPSEWKFGHFLNWLHLQEHESSTRKLMNLINIDEFCDEIEITDVIVPWDTTLPFTSEGSRIIHLNLGIGNRCRHVHIHHTWL